MCEFCDLLKNIKDKSEVSEDIPFTYKYKCALVAESFYKNKFKGRTVYAEKPLNFCPVCGRRIYTVSEPQYKARRVDTGEWVTGVYVDICPTKVYIVEDHKTWYEVDKSTVQEVDENES